MKGKIYNSDEAQEHMIDIQHKFHKTVETFEVYECPDCKGHFLVESEAVEGVSVIWCPYCKKEFEEINEKD